MTYLTILRGKLLNKKGPHGGREMQVSTFIALCSFGPLFLTSCSDQEERFKDQVVKAVDDNPEILTNAIRAHSREFAGAFQSALDAARQEHLNEFEKRRKANTQEAKELKYRPRLREDDPIRGKKDAPLTLVLYGSFEGRMAKEAFETARQLLRDYRGEIKLFYKHLPSEMHANAMISARYYEALRLQSEELALDFQERLFRNQQKLRRGEPYLKKLALSLGANESRLVRDLRKKIVTKRIEQDIEEAKDFGLDHRPSFVLNGIPITGAFPKDRFQDLISEIQTEHFASN